MDLEKALLDKIKRFEDVKNQIDQLNRQIGGLTEQRLALYNAGLELKGSIDALMELKAQEAKALEGSKTAGLTLPVGVRPVPAVAEDSVTASPVPAKAGEQTPGVQAKAPLEVL